MSSKKLSCPARRRVLRLESLERRNLLAISAVTFSGGALTVTADNAADTIDVLTQASGSAKYVAVGGRLVGASGGWATSSANALSSSSVTSLRINSGGGHDHVDLTGVSGSNFPNLSYGGAELHGEGGDDWLTGSALNDQLYGGAGNDNLQGGSGNDWLYGEDGCDYLFGGGGDDKLYGGFGRDHLYSGTTQSYGGDTSYGGLGDDEIYLESAYAGFSDTEGYNGIHHYNGSVSYSPNSGYGTGYGSQCSCETGYGGGSSGYGGSYGGESSGYGGSYGGGSSGYGGSNYANWNADCGCTTTGYGGYGGSSSGYGGSSAITFELDNKVLVIKGTANNDSITLGSNSSGWLTLNDLAIIDGDLVTDVVVYGCDGNDTLNLLGINRDVVPLQHVLAYGGNGNDTITGTQGADNLYGGAGNDTVQAYGGADTVYGGDGDDSVYGGAGNDALYGENGIDRLYGQDDVDMLNGGGGNDILDGGNFNDTFVDAAADTILDRPMFDSFSIAASSGNWVLSGTISDDTSPYNRTVTFTGVLTGSTTVQLDRSFRLSIPISSATGMVFANFTDSENLAAQTAYYGIS